MSFVDVAQGAAPMNVTGPHLASQPLAARTLRPAHLASKTQPMIWFPAACLFYWGEITRNEILLDAARRDERRKIHLTASEHVYVISNVGSFGENVSKIGLTRRLEPLDRIRELGDASVPFEFDVHTLIRSDDAPALEHALHQRFVRNQVNKVNARKEFFRVDPARDSHGGRSPRHSNRLDDGGRSARVPREVGCRARSRDSSHRREGLGGAAGPQT